jgi:hypothetical protein
VTRAGAKAKRKPRIPAAVLERAPATIVRGDLAQLAREVILPAAAAEVEAAQLREVMRERDGPPPERRTFHCVTLPNGEIETVSQLPWGMPAIRGRSIADLHWRFRQSLIARCITRDAEKARQMSHGNAITFVVVGGA